MLTIYLARHGQNEDNANGILNGHRDLPLTPKGVEQAQEVAQEIAKSHMHFTHIYASPLSRAFRTAQIISEGIKGPKPEVEPLLIERDFGVMTGKETTRITELCAPDIIQGDPITYFLSPEGAETFPQLVERAKSLLKKLTNQHKSGSILLVTHGDFGKMIYAAYYDLPWHDVLLQFHFGNSELILLSPDSPAEAAHVFTIEQHNH